MINLLFQEERIKNYNEYRVRRLTVLLVFLSVIFGLFVFLIACFYTMQNFVGSATADKLKNLVAESKVNKFTELSDQIKTTNLMLAKLRAQKTALPPISQIIPKISDGRSVGVRLNHFSFTNDSKGAMAVEVRGIATNRKAVVAFGDFISANKSFVNLKSPIVNLLKDVNNDFTVTFNVK